jgi:hypothetical protein
MGRRRRSRILLVRMFSALEGEAEISERCALPVGAMATMFDPGGREDLISAPLECLLEANKKALFPGLSLMELAGLEPATSWVRSRRSAGAETRWLSHFGLYLRDPATSSPTLCRPARH